VGKCYGVRLRFVTSSLDGRCIWHLESWEASHGVWFLDWNLVSSVGNLNGSLYLVIYGDLHLVDIHLLGTHMCDFCIENQLHGMYFSHVATVA
jgi:hypothetical protein